MTTAIAPPQSGIDAIQEAIDEADRQNEIAILDSYWRLCQAINTGQKLTVQQVDEALGLRQLLGKTRADMEADCQLLRQREGWAKLLTEEPALVAQQTADEQERLRLVKERDAYLAKVNARLGELNNALQQTSARLAQIAHARDRLFNSYRNAAVEKNERGLSAKAVTLRDAITSAEQRLAEQVTNPLKHASAALRTENERTVEMKQIGRDARNAQTVTRLQGAIANLETTEKNDRAAIAALVAEQDQVQAELSELAKLHYQP